MSLGLVDGYAYHIYTVYKIMLRIYYITMIIYDYIYMYIYMYKYIYIYVYIYTEI